MIQEGKDYTNYMRTTYTNRNIDGIQYISQRDNSESQSGWVELYNNIRSTYKAQTASLNYALSRNRGNVHVAYNNNLGGEYVYGGSHADYPTVTELQQGLTNYYTCDYYRIGGSITYSQQVRENRRMNLFAKVVFDRVNTSDYDYDGRTHLSISLGCNF